MLFANPAHQRGPQPAAGPGRADGDGVGGGRAPRAALQEAAAAAR